VPEQAQIMIGNVGQQRTWCQGSINSLLQGKWEGALARSLPVRAQQPLGLGGLFDPGKVAELQPSQEDFGQTARPLGVRLVRISSCRFCSDRRPFATVSARRGQRV